MPFRAGWNKAKAWFIHLLHLDESAHSIALGTAIGVFLAMTPTIGIQMLLTVLVTSTFRANRIAGVPMAWITNPATIVPIYSLNYGIGRAIVGGPGLAEFQRQAHDLMRIRSDWFEWVGGWWHLMIDTAAPLWTGSIIVGLVSGAVAYAVMYYLITVYRRHHRRRLALAAAAQRAGDDAAAARREHIGATDGPDDAGSGGA